MSIGSLTTAGMKTLVGGRSVPPAVIWVPAVVVGAALLLPLVYLVVRTFDAGGDIWDLLFRQRVAAILGRTILLVVTVTAASVALALPLAWLTTRTDLPFRRTWVVLSALPLVIPSYVAGFIVIVALGPRGMLQQALDGPFGIDRLPDIHGFTGAMLTLTFLSFPYVVLTVRAALLRIDPSMEESSRSLGRGSWTTFFSVTLPLLRPGDRRRRTVGGPVHPLRLRSGVAAALRDLYQRHLRGTRLRGPEPSRRTVLVFGGAGPGHRGIGGAEPGPARARYYSSSSAASRPPSTVRLGRWRWPALAFCSTIVAVSLAAPMSILGYWVARGISVGEPLNLVWEAVGNSIYIAALAATAAVIAALPVAALSVRYPGVLSGLLERLSYVGFALPGIAIALALVFFGARYAPPLYQTTGLLLLAYVVLFLSPAMGAVRTSILQISPRIDEAARGLGNSPLRAFSSVTLPIARPGILAGWALVFLLVMKELPATLILSPDGFNTLATSIWSALPEAFFARAALPALLLIAASAVPLAFLMLRERR